MKLAKLSLVAAIVLGGLVACSIATAQETNNGTAKKGKRGGGIEQRMDRLSTQLNLTDDQKPKVKAVLEDQVKQMKDIRALPQDQRREKFQAMQADETKKMKDILTPDQFEKYQKMMQHQGKRGGKKSAE